MIGEGMASDATEMVMPRTAVERAFPACRW
jgi:hypothetical protein